MVKRIEEKKKSDSPTCSKDFSKKSPMKSKHERAQYDVLKFQLCVKALRILLDAETSRERQAALELVAEYPEFLKSIAAKNPDERVRRKANTLLYKKHGMTESVDDLVSMAMEGATEEMRVLAVEKLAEADRTGDLLLTVLGSEYFDARLKALLLLPHDPVIDLFLYDALSASNSPSDKMLLTTIEKRRQQKAVA